MKKKLIWSAVAVLALIGIGSGAAHDKKANSQLNVTPTTSQTSNESTSDSTYSPAQKVDTTPNPSPSPKVDDNTSSPTKPNTGVDDNNLSNSNTYTNVDGNTVHSPAASTDGSVPDGATARCGDGSYSFSQHRSGTCSHHGGVAQWL